MDKIEKLKKLMSIENLIFKRKIKKKKRLNRSTAGNIVILLFLLIFSVFSAYPLIFIIANAFKPLHELFIFPPRLFPSDPTFKNFSDLLILMGTTWVPMSRYIFNTVFITLVGTVGHVIIASMCAFPLAKHQFPGKTFIFTLIIYSLMFSGAVTSTPVFMIMSWIGLVDTLFAVIIPAFAFPLGLYLMKQFMETIPDSLLEAAKIDGANDFKIFWSVVMPLAKPAWLTLIILLFQSLWSTNGGGYIFSEQLKTLSYALGQIVSGGIARAGTAAAVSVVMLIVPITIFILSQSKIIDTMSHSGIK
ncbi:MAG: transporter, permease protein [Haloplasmataceae bacterium]|jgi:ABC-type glycerol-3-phosphate transport system permease component|nr:transporter, permease protein [Haloplasmataceae bacterium]